MNGEEPESFSMGDLLDAIDTQEVSAAGEAARTLLRGSIRARPHALDAECSILAGILYQPDAIEAVVAAGVVAGDFYRETHQTIFAAMMSLRDRGTPAGTITVVDELQRRRSAHGFDSTLLDDVGGASAIAALESMMPSVALIPAHAKIVKDKAAARAMLVAAEELATHAYSGNLAPHDAAERIGQKLQRIVADQPAATPFQRSVDEARKELMVALSKAATTGAAKPYFSSSLDLIGMDIPRVSWGVKGLVTRGRKFGMIAGEPKGSKTWGELELVLAASTGTRAFGEFETGPPQDCAVFLTEDDVASYKNRVLALAAGRGMPAEVAFSRLHHACLSSLDLRSMEDAARLVASIRALPAHPVIVTVDPLRNVIGGAEEDSASEMAPILQMCRAVAVVADVTLLLVHHAGKSNEKTKARRGGQNLRGSSSIHGALDFGLYLSDLRTDGQTYWQSKVESEVKSARSAGLFGLELDIEDDEHGTATCARWTFHRDQKTMPSFDDAMRIRGHDLGDPTKAVTMDRTHALVLGLLRDEASADQLIGRLPRPWSASEIAARTSLHVRHVQRDLADLAELGRVEKSTKGWAFKNGKEGGSDVF